MGVFYSLLDIAALCQVDYFVCVEVLADSSALVLLMLEI